MSELRHNLPAIHAPRHAPTRQTLPSSSRETALGPPPPPTKLAPAGESPRVCGRQGRPGRSAVTFGALASLLVVALFVVPPAAAQYTQYAAPGELAIPDPPSREAFETAMSDARWRVGPLRLEPSIWLSDLRWVEDAQGVVGGGSDFTATVGAGLHGYGRLGPDVVVAVRALPEYVWWKEQDQLSTVNGRYGVGLFGFMSRLRFQLSAGSDRQADYLSTEVDRLVNSRDDSARAGFEVDLPGRMALFGVLDSHEYRYEDEDIFGTVMSQLLSLERDDLRVRGGVKVALSSRVRVGLGFESSETDFVRPERDRSNSGAGPLLEVEMSGAHVTGSLLVVWPDLEPEPGSEFLCFDDPLGYARVTWKPGGTLSWEAYGASDLVYSVQPQSPYYRNERVGLAMSLPLGWRAKLRLFVEAGTDEYAETPQADQLDDDRTSYGASLSFELGRQTALSVRVTQIEYDRGDRSDFRLEAGLSVGAGRGGWY